MKPPLDSIHISIKPDKIVRFLGIAVIFLVFVSIAGQIVKNLFDTSQFHILGFRPIEIFYLDAEENIPTGFSVLLLLFSAILLALIAFTRRREGIVSTFYWTLLSLGFFFMASDEAWQIHEGLIMIFRRWLGGDSFGIFYYAWVIPYSIIVGFLAVFFCIFLLRLPSKTRNVFLIAATLYLGGAIGLELVGGYYDEIYGQQNFIYSMIITVEESLEMTGIVIFIWALLKEINRNSKEVRLVFK